MATFVLVHGAYLGPWSWNLVISSLNRRGHQAINIELPANNGQLGATDYAQFTTDQIKNNELKDELVIVGHDIANLFIPLLHEQFTVRRFICLAPLLAIPASSMQSQIVKGPDNILLSDAIPDPIANRSAIFKYWLHDCDPDIASWAVSRFSKQNYEKLFSEISPIEAIPKTDTAVILCKNDRLVNSPALGRVSKSLLKVSALSIDSGHCPQLSRPQELALLIMQLGNIRK